MNPLDALLDHHPLPSWRVLAWPVMLLMATLLIWANFTELDEVTVATGLVVPQGQVRVVQHLEGGIIESILVADGARVTRGQTLLRLNLASSGVNREELQVRLDGQILVRARLEAEASGKKMVFPAAVAKRRPEQVIAQRRAFEARKREINSSISVIRNQVNQRESEIQELAAKARAINNNLKLAKERYKLSKSLLADGLIPKIELLQLEAEVESLEGEQKGIAPTLAKIRSTVQEAKGRVREAQQRYRRESEEELVKTEQAIGRITELLSEASAQGARAEVRSPITGVVKNMRYHTIGGVVKPGEAIMEIVPTGEKLVIEAKLKTTDRAYVTQDQNVTVKLATYDFIRYGGLNGKVLMVAPDSSTDEKGNPFFRMVVQTDKTYLGEREGELPIMPGMEATVDVHTGTKSVIDFLIKPVLKLKQEAFRER